MEVRLRKIADSFRDSTKSYELSALICADSFFYVLFDYGQQVIKTDWVQSKIPNHEMLLEDSQASFRRAKFALFNKDYLILPNGIYQQDQLQTLFREVNGFLGEGYLFRSESVDALDVRVCYAVSKHQLKQLNQDFDSPVLIHHMTAQLCSIPTFTKGRCVLYVTYIQEKMMLSLVDGKQLVWSNFYECKNVNAFVYYIGVALQTLQVDLQSVDIMIAGWLHAEHQYIRTIQTYYSGVTIHQSELTLPGNELANHQYYQPLVAISQCA